MGVVLVDENLRMVSNQYAGRILRALAETARASGMEGAPRLLGWAKIANVLLASREYKHYDRRTLPTSAVSYAIPVLGSTAGARLIVPRTPAL